EALTKPGATGGLATPPEEFASPLGCEIWATASETAQLHRLSALAHEVRTSRAEADHMARLALKTSDRLKSLLPLIRPSAASLSPPPPHPHPSSPRPAPWRPPALRGLAAVDKRGDLHPTQHEAEAWAQVEVELAPLRQQPPR